MKNSKNWSNALLGLAAAAFVLAAVPARADQAAEAFVSAILVEANATFKLTDKSERDAGIETLVEQYVDMDRIAMFVLGQYARAITPEQKAVYLPLFRSFATRVYQDALSTYSGERLAVTGSVDRSPKDVIVNSKVAEAKPGDAFYDMVVHWRVYRDADGAMSIFDAGADDVWLAIEQQSQFKSVIANNGGGAKGIDALIADLKAKLGTN